jgi:hypothetical protein
MTALMLAAGLAMVFGSGVAVGWTLARRSTRYMIGGRW